MSNVKINEIKPFRQVPSCEPTTELTITAAEFNDVQSIINAFKPAIAALDNVFNRSLNDGKIVIKYVQEDGTEISQEEATAYLQKAKEYLDNKEKSDLKAV